MPINVSHSLLTKINFEADCPNFTIDKVHVSLKFHPGMDSDEGISGRIFRKHLTSRNETSMTHRVTDRSRENSIKVATV